MREALDLPLDERLALVDALLASLDPSDESSTAAAEVDDAVAFYESCEVGLGRDFALEVQRGLKRIAIRLKRGTEGDIGCRLEYST